MFCFLGSLGRGETISTGHGRSVALRGDEKTRPAVLDARSGDKDSERGVKGGPYQGREDKGSWRGADQAPGFLFSGPRRRAGATCAPRRGRSAAGCGDGLGESRELAFPLGKDREAYTLQLPEEA